jgi:uncharacterized protein YuzE
MGVSKILAATLLIASLATISLYIHQLPYLPLDTDYSKALPELSSTEPLELLNPKTGLLNYEGWGKFPNKWLYNHDMHKSYTPLFNRHKHWNYYYVIAEGHLVTMAHTDMGLAKAAYINIRDIKDMSKPIIEVKSEDFLGHNLFIDIDKNGEGVYSTINTDKLNMTFFR